MTMKKKPSWMIVLAALVFCVFMGTALGEASNGKQETAEVENPVRAVCENGVMLGRCEQGVISFKGVPYAKPPVGTLRWKAPQAPDPGDREIECFEFGYTALQIECPSEQASYFPKSEDCLTLNIWANADKAAGEVRPVMVFFHGGAFSYGGTTDPLYDGQRFAKAHDDVILVTCNYRLGLMGFPDFSKIEGGEEYTEINLALRDQIAALEWIQRNIAAFGGDPDNVTIFGESAGAFSVTAMMLSPKAKGLFRRAIAQSGEVAPKPREAAQAYADFIMEVSGAKNMEELLAISGEEWMQLDRKYAIGDTNCLAVTDGDIIPEDLAKAYEEAAKSGVQLIIGSNADEWNYFRADCPGDTDQEKLVSWVQIMKEMYQQACAQTDAEGKAALEELIRYEESIVPEEYAKDAEVKEALTLSGFVTEAWRYEILDFAERFADAGGDVRVYLWTIPSTKEEKFKSAVHAVELGYVFNNEDPLYAGEIDPEAAAKVQEAWVSFAKTGVPLVNGIDWKPYHSDTRETLVIGKDEWTCVQDPSKTPRKLLEKAFGDNPYRVW